MIQKNEFPILEYDFDSIEILKPNHGAEQLTLPEKCVFAFLGTPSTPMPPRWARGCRAF